MKNETFTCTRCKQEKPVQHSGGTGYGKDANGNIVCYACCAELDKEQMTKGEPITLYLTCQDFLPWKQQSHHISGKVTNWPGTLEIPCNGWTGCHNIAGIRYDVWFTFAGHKWHGVQYGNNTQLCHCKTVKNF
jgi:transcription elongation factor Elf1